MFLLRFVAMLKQHESKRNKLIPFSGAILPSESLNEILWALDTARRQTVGQSIVGCKIVIVLCQRKDGAHGFIWLSFSMLRETGFCLLWPYLARNVHQAEEPHSHKQFPLTRDTRGCVHTKHMNALRICITLHLTLDKMHDKVSRFHVVSTCHSDFGFRCHFFAFSCLSAVLRAGWLNQEGFADTISVFWTRGALTSTRGRNRRQKRRLWHVFRHGPTCVEKRILFCFILLSFADRPRQRCQKRRQPVICCGKRCQHFPEVSFHVPF